MDPLAAAYERCRRLHRRHGRSYYLATRLLPAWKRRHVHALYGFSRYADDIVDATADLPAADRARRLAAWSARFLAGLDGVPVDDPLLPAVLHTIRVFDLDLDDFRWFLASMAADLTVTGYDSYTDLLAYMAGSAAAIGTMMLPILGSGDRSAAREPARQLGFAFQMTNFIRDVAEDHALGRVYLPRADLARFGLTPADLAATVAARRGTAATRALIAFEIGRARAHYAAAAPGIPLFQRSPRPCVRAGFRVYGAILDGIERAGHDVFAGRVVVPRRRRLALLCRSWSPAPLSAGPPVRQLAG